ncbi:putative protein-serine/threonine phosphatase [Lupinus albus]|uniref:Aminotransferase-like plant mobile domain-containing protein n=1 Tax=Lupinus albus TaxID=3870 RepID=A0A6A4R1T2_LUPAL|nr:putative protein-serine/threonine phosphatase [Lupinus albus]
MEVRDDFMVSPAGDSVPTLRTAHFLKPIANSIDDTQVSGFFQPNKWPLQFRLNSGWGYQSKKWIEWVDTLYPKFESLWKKVGIFDAIMSTKYYIIKNEDLAIGVAEKWCSKTNTFLFPWGEATITLEDVMVLGGFPVVGDPVFTPLGGVKMDKIEKQLLLARRELWRTRSCKCLTSAWVNMFKDSGREIEHEAFLTTWLSMFVFPHKGFIGNAVFRIAIHLARGNQIALAPAVLASIYKDLGCLKDTIIHLTKSTEVSEVDLEVKLQSEFYLVQIWVWERFNNLKPEPNLINNGDPILARWHKVKALEIDNVRLALNLAFDDFIWRPYVIHAGKWRVFYPESELCALNFDPEFDKELLSFVTCLRASELVGIGSIIEQYLPHRVSMQFGMDQDVPGCVPRRNQTKAIAWENYCRPICHRNLYFPSRLFEADVTTTYARWWKQTVVDHLDPVKNIVQQKRSARRSSSRWTHASKANRSGNDASVPPGFPPKYVSNMISGKCCDDGSKAINGDNVADLPSYFLPKRLNHCNRNTAAASRDAVRNLNHCSVPDDLEANDDTDTDVPTSFYPKYNTLKHCDSVENCKPVFEDNKSLGNVTAYECQHLSNQCSSASTSDHGAVEKILPLSKLYEKDNIDCSIGGLEEDFEDANGSEYSRMSTDKASLSGTQDEDHSDSSKTNVEELERRINKLEAEFEQRIEKVQREITKLMKARFGHS